MKNSKSAIPFSFLSLYLWNTAEMSFFCKKVKNFFEKLKNALCRRWKSAFKVRFASIFTSFCHRLRGCRWADRPLWSVSRGRGNPRYARHGCIWGRIRGVGIGARWAWEYLPSIQKRWQQAVGAEWCARDRKRWRRGLTCPARDHKEDRRRP